MLLRQVTPQIENAYDANKQAGHELTNAMRLIAKAMPAMQNALGHINNNEETLGVALNLCGAPVSMSQQRLQHYKEQNHPMLKSMIKDMHAQSMNGNATALAHYLLRLNEGLSPQLMDDEEREAALKREIASVEPELRSLVKMLGAKPSSKPRLLTQDELRLLT